MTQTVTPELKAWIIAQSEAGHQPEVVLAAMRAAGWADEVAQDALASTLIEHLSARDALPTEALRAAGLDPSVASASAATRLPAPDLSASPRALDLGDRMVDLLFSLRHPRVVLFGNFLSPQECEALIEAARPRLARSLTVQTRTGGEQVNAARTSDGMFFKRGETELIGRIEARIARLLNWPVENGEGVQVLHYLPGAEYKPHYDYFDPGAEGTASIIARGGQRVATLVMYLNEPEAGGGTTFPEIGLEVAPQRGSAVYFGYERPDPSTGTLHGGAPVLAGEKWVATKWLREREFT